jgi:F0F1-type ATP synthase delta subunit
MVTSYAKALYDAAHQEGADPKALVANLSAALAKRGNHKLLPAILQEVLRLEAREAKLAPRIEVASAGESAHSLKEAATHGIHAAHAHVNPALIKGWRAVSKNTLVDHSAKRSLIELYQRITG